MADLARKHNRMRPLEDSITVKQENPGFVIIDKKLKNNWAVLTVTEQLQKIDMGSSTLLFQCVIV